MNQYLPQIAILLCTLDGGRFLRPQLDSIRPPDGCDCHIYLSDDGSRDDTQQVARDYAESNDSVPLTLRRGPGAGHAANFLSLLNAPDVEADFYAFSDQDDLWDANKLDVALAALYTVDADTAAVYCSRTRSISEAGADKGRSPRFRRPPSFANALIQNIAGGNTMVLNRKARQLLVEAGRVEVVAHDWWVYQLVSGAGGRVIYDPEPHMSYRQHDRNAIGANTGVQARGRRYLGFLSGRNRRWNQANLAALKDNQRLLTPENSELLQVFERLRSDSLTTRLAALLGGPFYAQTLSGNIGLWLATLLKKI